MDKVDKTINDIIEEKGGIMVTLRGGIKGVLISMGSANDPFAGIKVSERVLMVNHSGFSVDRDENGNYIHET